MFAPKVFVLLALVATSSALQHAARRAGEAPRARKDIKDTTAAAVTAAAKMTAPVTTKMPKATSTMAPTAAPTAAPKMTAPKMTAPTAAPTAAPKMTAPKMTAPVTTKMPKATATMAPTAAPTLAAKIIATTVAKSPKVTKSPKATKAPETSVAARVTMEGMAATLEAKTKHGKKGPKKGDAAAADTALGRDSGSGDIAGLVFMERTSHAERVGSGVTLFVAGVLVAVGVALKRRTKDGVIEEATEDSPLLDEDNIIIV